MLTQHWWSYAGNENRKATSQTNIQYFINYRLSAIEMIGMTPNIRVNWKAEDNNKLTWPIGIGYSRINRIGGVPFRWVAEFQYSVIKRDAFGSKWNIRLLFILIIANPLK